MWANKWIILAMGLCFGVMAGCAGSQTGDKRFRTADGAEMPPVVATEANADTAEAKNNHPAPDRAVVTVHAVGRGIAPEDAISRGQAIILGEGAARANGYVRLAEKIHGVYVDSFRQMGRGVMDVEMVHQETQAWLRGAEVIECKEVDHGIFEAQMRVKLIVPRGHPLFPTEI